MRKAVRAALFLFLFNFSVKMRAATRGPEHQILLQYPGTPIYYEQEPNRLRIWRLKEDGEYELIISDRGPHQLLTTSADEAFRVLVGGKSLIVALPWGNSIHYLMPTPADDFAVEIVYQRDLAAFLIIYNKHTQNVKITHALLAADFYQDNYSDNRRLGYKMRRLELDKRTVTLTEHLNFVRALKSKAHIEKQFKHTAELTVLPFVQNEKKIHRMHVETRGPTALLARTRREQFHAASDSVPADTYTISTNTVGTYPAEVLVLSYPNGLIALVQDRAGTAGADADLLSFEDLGGFALLQVLRPPRSINVLASIFGNVSGRAPGTAAKNVSGAVAENVTGHESGNVSEHKSENTSESASENVFGNTFRLSLSSSHALQDLDSFESFSDLQDRTPTVRFAGTHVVWSDPINHETGTVDVAAEITYVLFRRTRGICFALFQGF